MTSYCRQDRVQSKARPPIPTTTALDDQLLDPGYFADPYRAYDRLRADAPVYWSDHFDAWLVTRYRDVDMVIRDVRRFSNAHRVPAMLKTLPPTTQAEIAGLKRHFSTGLVQSDPPDHDRIRALVNRAFTPQVVEGLRPRIMAQAHLLLDAVEGNASMDLVADLAYPLPVTVISELVGIPIEDRDQYKAWSNQIFGFLGSGVPTEAAVREAQAGLDEMEAYFSRLFEERRSRPRDDLLTALVQVRDSGGRLSHDELLALFSTFVSAGHETTTSLIAAGLYSLLRHRREFDRVRADRSLLKPAVEEMLRFESPLQRDAKVAVEEVEVGAATIRPGDVVWAMLGAANRDPEAFDDPGGFDIGRPANRHLAFGMGPHFCLGAPLARLEATVVLDAVLDRLPRLALADGPIEWRRDYALRGPISVHVTF